MASRCPPGVFCIENATLLAALIILGLVGTLVYTRRAPSSLSGKPTARPSPRDQGSIDITQIQLEPSVRQYPGCAVSAQPENVFLNPYSAPLRNGSPGCGPGLPINIPTQGVEASYRQVGLLTRVNGPETILPLMGRPLIPARDKWNFYTMASNQAQVKLPIRVRKRDCTSEHGCDDLSSGDLVAVEGYDAMFRVRMYENSAPRYIPYL